MNLLFCEWITIILPNPIKDRGRRKESNPNEKMDGNGGGAGFGWCGCAAGFAENVYTPGTYAAQAKGFGGVVSVSVTFDEKGMTDVRVEAPDETSGIGSVAAEKLPAAILNAQSAQVDTVSGATFTSKAVISAVEDCIAQASGQNTEAVVKMAPAPIPARAWGSASASR